ncbi:hypothetical protein K1719_002349 [Acacia pycnantha]|nr:hypothetical protein K1719_002349 [Acacia pycnantha]
MMAKSGLYILVSESAQIPWFASIFPGIGDEQSLSQSLSTFSGHLKHKSHKPVWSMFSLLSFHLVCLCYQCQYVLLHGLVVRPNRIATGRSNAINIAERLGLRCIVVDVARKLCGAASAEIDEVINCQRCLVFPRLVEQCLSLPLGRKSNPHIALLPLHPDIQAKFNETAAWEYSRSMVGQPYGYNNMIFSWIDTLSENYPPPLDAHVVASFMTVWNHLQPKYVAIMRNEALNKRLGMKC